MIRQMATHPRALLEFSVAVQAAYMAVGLSFPVFLPAQPSQVPVARVEKMPNLPAPYVMRGWKAVALRYDSLVYNRLVSGQ